MSARYAIDGHADSFGDVLRGARSYLERSATGHLDLPRQREAGIALSIQAVYTPAEHQGDAAWRYALDMAAGMLSAMRRARGALKLVREPADLDALGQAPAILMHLEGASPLGQSLDRSLLLDAIGFRSIGLTHDPANQAAGGCRSAPEQDHLTAFGRDLVIRCDELGWLIDAAHLGPRSLDQLLATSVGPIVSSHTGLRARVPDHPRGLTDAQARALADTDGLVAIDFVPEHLVPTLPATREDVFRHLDHAVSLLGDRHVAIGSDFDGYTTPLDGMPDATGYPWITQRMREAGYPEPSIDAILAGNWQRVMRARFALRV